MGVMISDLPGLESMSPDDMMELEKKNDNESYSVSIKQLMDYFKNTSNGGFKGATNKNLDEFDVGDVGTYFWSGVDGPDGMPMGILEVASMYSVDDYTNTAFNSDVGLLLQRITYGKYVYQRMRGIGTENWSAWGGLTNENGCKIVYGVSSEDTVYFSEDHSDVFATAPVVTVTPIGAGQTEVYFVNVETVTTSYFTVKRFVAPLVARVVTETQDTDTTESTTSGTTKKTTKTTEKIITTDGAIKVVGSGSDTTSFAFNWQAMSDVPNTKFKAT